MLGNVSKQTLVPLPIPPTHGTPNWHAFVKQPSGSQSAVHHQQSCRSPERLEETCWVRKPSEEGTQPGESSPAPRGRVPEPQHGAATRGLFPHGPHLGRPNHSWPLGKCKAESQWGVPDPARTAVLRKTGDNYWEDAEKRQPPLPVGTKTGAATMENGMEAPAGIKSGTIIWSRNPISGYRPTGNKINLPKSCLNSHTERSIIHNRQDTQTASCPATHEWVKKMWCIHTQRTTFQSLKKKDQGYLLIHDW